MRSVFPFVLHGNVMIGQLRLWNELTALRIRINGSLRCVIGRPAYSNSGFLKSLCFGCSPQDAL